FLNPPYDTDREHRRLEQRFLARFTDALAPGGALVFVVPHAALAASAELLASRYARIGVWRFPDPDFAAFKQVVVVAEWRREPRAQNPRRPPCGRPLTAEVTCTPVSRSPE
ncbi:MAG: DUF6094 domain-containing protein, partial [Thermoanaerobaculia bacterium]|nr:DUF6094 domain-containing protein [Thermoanaerobaculia bacterium]